ncbi:MAG: hypothetical protein PHC34_09180 [Candidatus Gastranaerophilales bacterium]|nr:hypothetical protein [Candidatus Gastranaerophilales bacterium]
MVKKFDNIIKNSCVILVCLFSTCIIPSSFAQNVSLKELDNQNVVTFYEGTLFKAILQQKISTGINNICDKVELITPADINLGETVCMPKDSKFIGKIVKLGKPEIGTNGYFQILFDTLRLPDGQNISIMARVWTKKNDYTIGGEATARSGFRPIVHNVQGMGSYIQQLPAGSREMGKDSELLPGSEVLIVLDKQLSFSVFKD